MARKHARRPGRMPERGRQDYGPLTLLNTASAQINEKTLQRLEALRDKVLFRRVRINRCQLCSGPLAALTGGSVRGGLR